MSGRPLPARSTLVCNTEPPGHLIPFRAPTFLHSCSQQASEVRSCTQTYPIRPYSQILALFAAPVASRLRTRAACKLVGELVDAGRDLRCRSDWRGCRL